MIEVKSRYRFYDVSEPQEQDNGTYRVYILRANGSAVATGDGDTPELAEEDAKSNLNYYLDGE